jgi:hypothetical protein
VADAITTAWSAGPVPEVKLSIVAMLIPTKSSDMAEAWIGKATESAGVELVGFIVPAADDAGSVGDKQGSELGLGVVSEVVAGAGRAAVPAG